MATEKHVHDCTGPDRRCPCGFVFRVPPISVSIDVANGSTQLVNEMFNCDDIEAAIDALRDAADRLESEL